MYSNTSKRNEDGGDKVRLLKSPDQIENALLKNNKEPNGEMCSKTKNWWFGYNFCDGNTLKYFRIFIEIELYVAFIQ